MTERYIEEVRRDAQQAAETVTSFDLGALEVQRAIETNFQPRVEVAVWLDGAAQGESLGLSGRRES